MDLDRIRQHIAHGEQGSVRDFSLALRGVFERGSAPSADDVSVGAYPPGGIPQANLQSVLEDLANRSLRSLTFDSAEAIEGAVILAAAASIDLRGFYSPGDGGGGPRVEGTSSDPGAIQSADGRWWVPAKGQPLHARMFGVRGDGAADDTDRLQAAFDFVGSGTLLCHGLRVRLTDTVSIGSHRAEVQGGEFLADTQDMTVFSVSGDDFQARYITIDGQDKAAFGIEVTGARPDIQHNAIRNLRAIHRAARAITISNSGTGCRVLYNTLENIHAVGNSQLGDGPGSARAVHVHSTVPATAPQIIAHNEIRSVTGEEGDSIHLLFSAGGNTKNLDARALVQHNTIIDFTRRAVKVQAGGTIVEHNWISCWLPFEDLPNAIRAIDLQYGENCIVKNNTADLTSAFSFCTATGRDGQILNGIVIRDNDVVLRDDGATPTAIFATYTKRLSIRGNRITNPGRAIALGDSERFVVDGNEISGGRPGSESIAALSSTSGVISNNTFLDGNASYAIRNGSPNVVVRDNASFYDEGGMLRAGDNASYSLYYNNAAYNSSGAYSSVANLGNAAEQIMVNNYRMNPDAPDGDSVPFTFWSDESPQTKFSNFQFEAGSFCFNSRPTSGGVLGWRCTSKGKPGTWQAVTLA